MKNRVILLSEAERAMKLQEVILRAMAGDINWIEASEIIGISPRQMRRWKKRYQEYGYDGLYDRRKKSPSPRRIPLEVVQKVLRLYDESYKDYNVKHFHEEISREHDIKVSYSWTKNLLQSAGRVKKSKKRGKYRRRRPRKRCEGMLVHLDGSLHRWFAHPEDEYQTLLVIMDDATSEILAAKFVAQESSQTCLEMIYKVVKTRGTFASLYTDRASHFVHTPKAGQKPDRSKKTYIEQVLDELGIELIVAYSPEARGRGERVFGTLQDRLVNELKRARIRTYEGANAYLNQCYLPKHHKNFAREAKEKVSSFLPVVGVNLERIFARSFERTVNRDNTIEFEAKRYQLPKVKGISTLATRKVEVRKHLCGKVEVLSGKRLIASFETQDRTEQSVDEKQVG